MRCSSWASRLAGFPRLQWSSREQQLLRRPADSEWATTRSTSNDQSILPPHCAAITCVLVAAGKKSARVVFCMSLGFTIRPPFLLSLSLSSPIPWPNDAPYSSQPEPSHKIKTCISGWPNDTAKSSQLARNHSIVWIRPRSHITITKQLGESLPELAEVDKRWKTWLELSENLSLIKFKPTRSNSSQLKRYPTPSKLWTWLELRGPFGQGLIVLVIFMIILFLTHVTVSKCGRSHFPTRTSWWNSWSEASCLILNFFPEKKNTWMFKSGHRVSYLDTTECCLSSESKSEFDMSNTILSCVIIVVPWCNG